jgi:hypothetical protein
MLQIISGKFFRDVDLYKTQHRYVLYTNARMFDDVATISGRASKTNVVRNVFAVMYEVEQRLEAVTTSGEPEILKSIGGDYLASDFAAVLALVWRVTCSTNIDVVRRLTRTSWPQADSAAPARYVQRIFDPEVAVKPEDANQLSAFLEQLIGLEREKYREVIRAIRRYNMALQRVGDDLPLAYLLLVASIESLAQKFDRFQPTWSDFDERKRRVIDAALDGVDMTLSERVRSAILEIEHVALGRRYREFALSKLRPSFFRTDATQYAGPARRRDLPKALARAYGLRSELIHRLGELPGMLTAAPTRNDIITIDGIPVLTFNGLARLAREVILTVVEEAPTVDREIFNYRRDLPNILRAPLAPRYWVWKAEGFTAGTANAYLSGFIGELATVLRGDDDARLTDITGVLQRIEELVPGFSPASRMPALVLYHLFHWYASADWHRPTFESFLQQYEQELNAPSIPSLVGHVLSGAQVDWPANEHDEQLECYFTTRFHKGGLHIDPLFESALLIHAAQRYLRHGSLERASDLVTQAADHLPGHPVLSELEGRMAAQQVQPADLEWRSVLLRKPDDSGHLGGDITA